MAESKYKQNTMFYNIGVDNHILLLKQSETNVKFVITNFLKLWSQDWSFIDIISMFKELNPFIDMDNSKIVEYVLNLYKTPNEQVCHKLEESVDGKELATSTFIGTFPVKVKFSLKTSNSDTMYQTFIVPIVSALKNFHQREEILLDIVKAKDAELEEFEREGMKISRHTLTTKPFSLKSFNEDNSIEVGEDLNLPQSLLDKLRSSEVDKKEQATSISENDTIQKDRRKAKRIEIMPDAGCVYAVKRETAVVAKKSRRKPLNL